MTLHEQEPDVEVVLVGQQPRLAAARDHPFRDIIRLVFCEPLQHAMARLSAGRVGAHAIADEGDE
eukprot:5340830-Prymnesium_polylepis.1